MRECEAVVIASASTGLPPDFYRQDAWRSQRSSLSGPGGLVLAWQLMEWKQWHDMQNPQPGGTISWRSSAVCGGAKSQKRLGQGIDHGVAAGFQPEGGHLVCLIFYLQGEVIQGLPAEPCRSWRGGMSVSPDKHRWCGPW